MAFPKLHIALFVVSFCWFTALGVHGAAPTSALGNIDSVCNFASEGFSVFGEKFLRYKPQCGLYYRGLGEQSLKDFMLDENACYNEIANSMCQLQFQEYEPSAECQNTAAFAFNLIKTCSKGSAMSSQYAHCEAYDTVTGTILNPETFCKESHLRIDKGQNRINESAGDFDVKAFPVGSETDCKRIAENYNACVLIGVNKLGYKNTFCTGGGFSAYCSKYPSVVKDPTYKLICKELVVPYMIERNRMLSGRRQRDNCKDMYVNYLLYLTAKKGDFLTKARAAKDSLRSIEKGMGMMSSFKRTTSALGKLDNELNTDSTSVLNQLRSLAESEMAVDSQVNILLQKLSADVTLAEGKMGQLQKPTLSSDMDENLEAFANAAPSFQSLIVHMQRALESVKSLQQLLAAGGHVAYKSSYGFFPLEKNMIESVRTHLKKIDEEVAPMTEQYAHQVDMIPVTQSVDEITVRADGRRYSEIADVFGNQIGLLVKMEKYSSQGGNPVEAASKAALAKSAVETPV